MALAFFNANALTQINWLHYTEISKIAAIFIPQLILLNIFNEYV